MRQYGNLLRGRKKYAFDSMNVFGFFFLKKRSVKAVDEKNNIATFVLHQIINRIKFGRERLFDSKDETAVYRFEANVTANKHAGTGA